MGITPTPDPGPFPAGDQCDECTLVTPVFAPGATPLTTVLTRHGGLGDPSSWTLTQHAPCDWQFLDANTIVQWFLVQAFPLGTAVNILDWVGMWIPSFAFFSVKRCLTSCPNQVIGPAAVGDWAELSW